MALIRPRPQRIVIDAAPGTLLKRLAAVHGSWQIKRVVDGESDRDYLAKIRECPCLHCGQDPAGEAAHLRMASGAHGKASGIGKRPADRWALPLCPEHHRLAQRAQHMIGERQFWSELGIDPFLTATKLWTQRADLIAMRAVVFQTIAERGR